MVGAAPILLFVNGIIKYIIGSLDKDDRSFRVASFVCISYVDNMLSIVFSERFQGEEQQLL